MALILKNVYGKTIYGHPNLGKGMVYEIISKTQMSD